MNAEVMTLKEFRNWITEDKESLTEGDLIKIEDSMGCPVRTIVIDNDIK